MCVFSHHVVLRHVAVRAFNAEVLCHVDRATPCSLEQKPHAELGALGTLLAETRRLCQQLERNVRPRLAQTVDVRASLQQHLHDGEGPLRRVALGVTPGRCLGGQRGNAQRAHPRVVLALDEAGHVVAANQRPADGHRALARRGDERRVAEHVWREQRGVVRAQLCDEQAADIFAFGVACEVEKRLLKAAATQRACLQSISLSQIA